jgi:hypothetical protein
MKRKNLILVAALITIFGMLLSASHLLNSARAQSDEQGPGKVHRVRPEEDQAGLDRGSREVNGQRIGDALTTGGTSATTPISYHGGPVIQTPTVYLIWYGNWNQANSSDTPSGQQIVRDFVSNIGGSPYFQINLSYGGGITSGVISGGETSDAYSHGTRLSDSSVQAVVTSAISSGRLPYNTNGVYFVLTSSDVSERSGFCTQYCGWHTAATPSVGHIRYAFVGNANRCLNACAAQTTSPNGNAGVDGMISVIAHELEEATTDPDLNAWYDSTGAENADKCAWTFGHAQYQVANGSWANVHLGLRDFLIQRNLYHNLNGTGKDFCMMNAVQN